MATNKVVFGNSTLIDLTADTVTASDVSVGVTAHDASGAAITGTKKLPGYITLEANTVTLDADHTGVYIRVTSMSGPSVDASSSDSSVVSVMVQKTAEHPPRWYVYISSVGSKAGTAIITVTTSDTETYEAATAYIFVHANFPALETVGFSEGSDAQIAEMVAADRNGDIDLRDYWNVGDTRIVKLAAMPATNVPETHAEQYAELVLLHEGGDNDGYRFIVGLKNVLQETGRIDDAITGNISWSDTERAAWCDNEFRNAIPSLLRPIFRQWTCVSGVTGKDGMTASATVYFALPAEKELTGAKSQSTTAEADALFQFDYYATAANRKKTKDINGGTAATYWLRSPTASTARVYFSNYASASSYQYATTAYGLAPIGRI